MRLHFTTRRYGWRQGLLALPRAFVANVIAILAARRAIVQYCRMLRSGEVIWDKTDHDEAYAPAPAPVHHAVRRLPLPLWRPGPAPGSGRGARRARSGGG